MSPDNTGSNSSPAESRRRPYPVSSLPLISPLSLGAPARLAISAVCAALLWTGVFWALQ